MLIKVPTAVRFYSVKRTPIKPFKEVLKRIQPSNTELSEKSKKNNIPEWKKQIISVKKKIGNERWSPSKRLSREEIESVRLLKRSFANITNTELSERFKVSPEAIRRILKSNWEPNDEEWEKVQKRWQRRGERIKELYANGGNISSNGHQVVENLVPHKKVIISSGRHMNTFDVIEKKVRSTKPTINSKDQKLKDKKLKLLEMSATKR
ncbi:Required for respiratory growth protein 9, mitochondrial [Nakaseomyces glabratus]|nr:Neugrin [Nakaseomyces glabratus]QNG15602.1 uncharacterized protein GWK60_K04675 [Nakaseomyces glabratus]SCV14242.1 Required for respiratory growth protein 9, mitochondrial [Nakaseomyces glabratus]SLM12808.1 Required for respiratory growth protein 9, mitochondrial [Nakaseomyces glabratus]